MTGDNLLLVYQAIHDVNTREIVSAEALLRQRRADGAIREASAITEAVEEAPSADLFLFDSWAMRTAFADAAQWPDAVHLNVNLSPREFEEGNIVARLEKLIGGCGIDPHRVNLEITETSYIERPEETMEVLEAVRKLGLTLWLDDFGTGHSSMTHLQHFPVEGMKIGGAFIKGILDDDRCAAIVKSLIGLGHDLGLKVTAEEVESEEQLAFLRDAGIDYIQGFLFSKPKPQEAFLRLL